jgi:proteasome assembly chaperone (PAC2) family protein
MTTSDHVRWLSDPTLRRPALIAGFSGWNDAADASSTAVRTLVEAWHAQPLAEIDPEEFTDFATVRPSVKLEDGRTRTIVWPTVSMWWASTPGSDVILVLGPEPSLRWRLFTEQIVSVAARYEASVVLSLGALLADVPHNRPVQVIGTANDDATIERFGLQRSRYEGPTGIVGVLQDACTQHGIPAASLWAAVPAYASQIPSPKAASALLSRAGEIIGTPAPLVSLHNDVVRYEERVDEMVEDDEDLAEYVSRLDTMADEADDDSTTDDEADDATSLADEVERFLREQEN